MMDLSEDAKLELAWWITSAISVYRPILLSKPQNIRTDASGEGSGATDLNSCSGGRWSTQELAFLKTK